MIAPVYIDDLEIKIASSRGKLGRKRPKKEFDVTHDDNQIVEEYEGVCEECEREVTKKVCPICKT